MLGWVDGCHHLQAILYTVQFRRSRTFSSLQYVCPFVILQNLDSSLLTWTQFGPLYLSGFFKANSILSHIGSHCYEEANRNTPFAVPLTTQLFTEFGQFNVSIHRKIGKTLDLERQRLIINENRMIYK
jgi:hypothetical protein